MEDTCVCCGEYIPEGRMVCYSCEKFPYSKVIIRDRYPEGFDIDLSVHKKKQMIFKGG